MHMDCGRLVPATVQSVLHPISHKDILLKVNLMAFTKIVEHDGRKPVLLTGKANCD